MKNLTIFVFAVMVLSQISCKRNDEVKPALSAYKDSLSTTLKDQNSPPVPILIAGLKGQPGFINGAPDKAKFNYPMGICISGDGSLLIADSHNKAIRKISKTNNVSTLIDLSSIPNAGLTTPRSVAELNNGTIGVSAYNAIHIYKNGTRKTLHYTSEYDFVYGITKNVNGTYFWYGWNAYYDYQPVVKSRKLISIDENLANPAAAISINITNAEIRSLSIAANDNKFLALSYEGLAECTHSGSVFKITDLTGLNAVAANHDGTKLYVANENDIKIVDRCLKCIVPVVSTLISNAKVAYGGLALSKDEKTLYFTSSYFNTVSKVNLP